jgi:hypothetical protein
MKQVITAMTIALLLSSCYSHTIELAHNNKTVKANYYGQSILQKGDTVCIFERHFSSGVNYRIVDDKPRYSNTHYISNDGELILISKRIGIVQ